MTNLPTALAQKLPEPAGATAGGEIVHRYRLRNVHGLQMDVMSLGGVVTELLVPDRNGKLSNINLAAEGVAFYESAKNPYFGALIGRVGNRIGQGRFTLDGQSIQLNCNNGPNHLHGGPKGYHARVWTVQPIASPDGAAIELRLTDPAGAENYPGKMEVRVVYTLTNSNGWRIDYEATSDAPTPINLTQHAYFNLRDGGMTDVLGHQLRIHAHGYTPVNDQLIPTGDIASVKGTPFDFTQTKSIGQDIAKTPGNPNGFDHNYVLEGAAGQLREIAEVYEPTTGRVMQVLTTEPGVQFYSGNFLDGTITSSSGAVLQKHHGFCLETQHFPDAVNQPKFPSTILRPGQTYRSRTEYRFSVR